MLKAENLSTLERKLDRTLCFINTYIVCPVYISFLIFASIHNSSLKEERDSDESCLIFVSRICLEILDIVTFKKYFWLLGTLVIF